MRFRGASSLSLSLSHSLFGIQPHNIGAKAEPSLIHLFSCKCNQTYCTHSIQFPPPRGPTSFANNANASYLAKKN
ncbi:MAG: hypothetical protein J3R72DRAFT_443971, partial [Linnemannia gamsii]